MPNAPYSTLAAVLFVGTAALGIPAWAQSMDGGAPPVLAQGYGVPCPGLGYGPGMMGPGMGGPGYGYGMMGPGMMGPGMMGPGMMGPGMMGPGMMGQGPGMMGSGMMGPGMMGHGSGTAQPGMMGGAGMRGMSAAIDENGDGLVSPDEAASRQEAAFTAMDADDDGFLTAEEQGVGHGGMGAAMGGGQGMQASPMHQQMMERRAAQFAEMDSDGDGKVSQAEFMAAGEAHFTAADLDQNGKVTVWEFRSLRRQM